MESILSCSVELVSSELAHWCSDSRLVLIGESLSTSAKVITRVEATSTSVLIGNTSDTASRTISSLIKGLGTNQVAPVDGPDPANEDVGGQELNQTNGQLDLANSSTRSGAGCDHCPESGKNEIQNGRDNSNDLVHVRHVCNEIPDLTILLLRDSDFGLPEVDGLNLSILSVDTSEIGASARCQCIRSRLVVVHIQN